MDFSLDEDVKDAYDHTSVHIKIQQVVHSHDQEDDDNCDEDFNECIVFHNATAISLDFLEALAGEDSHQITEGAEDGSSDNLEVGQGDDGIDSEVKGEETEEDSEDEVDDGFHGSVVLCCSLFLLQRYNFFLNLQNFFPFFSVRHRNRYRRPSPMEMNHSSSPGR